MKSGEEKKYSVFLVDDDKFLLDMYALKFKERGLDVSVGFGSDEALEKLRGGFCPDIMVLDMIMPGIDGFEFLEILKKEHLCQSTVIVALSNQGQETDIERAKKLGAHGYIVKSTAIPSEVLEQVLEIANKKSK